MSDNAGNGDLMKQVIIGLTSILIGVFGGSAVAGGKDTTATTNQTSKIEKIAESIHSIDKNTAVIKITLDGVEYRLKQIDKRVNDLEKDRHKPK